MPNRFQTEFPKFYARLTERDGAEIEHIRPPASHGMLCFAEFFMEAEGDQVLLDFSGGLRGGEYPIYYYAHGARPPSVRKLADSFET
jgi:hypothetical protein